MKTYRLLKTTQIDMNPNNTLEAGRVKTVQAGSPQGAAFFAPYDGVWLVFDEDGFGNTFRVYDLTVEEM